MSTDERPLFEAFYGALLVVHPVLVDQVRRGLSGSVPTIRCSVSWSVCGVSRLLGRHLSSCVSEDGTSAEVRAGARTAEGTIEGKLSADVPPGTEQHHEARWLPEVGRPVKYMIVIEKTPRSYGAYVPDVPGCVAAAETRSGVIQLMREALAVHLEGPREDGASIPLPQASAVEVELGVAATA